MVKSLHFIDESVFNYLGEDDYAELIALTGLCDEIRLNDGVVWVQYDELNEITAIATKSRNGKSLVYAGEKSDKTELDFVIEKDNK